MSNPEDKLLQGGVFDSKDAVSSAKLEMLIVTEDQIRTVAQHYIIAAIWADCQEGTNPRCPAKEREVAYRVCKAFIEQCEAAGGLFTRAVARFEHGYGRHLDAGSAEAAFGHDFWLTRQGHGVGFWDRDELVTDCNGEPESESEPDLGDLLTDQAHKFGECCHEQYRGWFYFHERNFK